MKRLRKAVANSVQKDYDEDYSLLGRLKSDCEYFLNYGNRDVKHLWAGNVEDQINMMYEIYDRLPEKPNWLTRKDIDMYYDQMCESSHGGVVSSSQMKSKARNNVKASNDGYNPYSFMVGDQLEWSGLHGGQYKGIVTNVNDEYVTVDVMWTSEDSGDTIIDTQQFEIATDPDGKECIIVWTYGSDAGYVYPPSSSSANSSTDIQSSYNAYGDILSFICPICQNDTVYSTEKDIYHPCEVDYEELFICDECGAELKAYPKYDGTVDFIPLMDDEY